MSQGSTLYPFCLGRLPTGQLPTDTRGNVGRALLPVLQDTGSTRLRFVLVLLDPSIDC